MQKGERIDDFDKKFERYQLFYLTEKYDNGEAGYSFVYSGRGGDPLRYARYVELFPLKEGEKTLSMNKILKIESHVLYKKGELTGESIMESFIGNY